MYDYISSLPAYENTAPETRELCRQKVLTAIKKLQPCNDRQLAKYLGWEINKINPRRFELVNEGLVEMAFKAPDDSSGRTVSYWKVSYTQRGLTQKELF